MIAEAHHLQVVEVAEGGVHGQGQRLHGPLGIGAAVEGMHVADEAPCAWAQTGHVGVGRDQAGRGGARVAGVVGQEVVVTQAEEAHVPPEARVVLLAVHEQEARRGDGVGPAAPGVDVGDALLLVDDEVLEDVQALPPVPAARGARASCGRPRRSSCARGGRRPSVPPRGGRPGATAAARPSSPRPPRPRSRAAPPRIRVPSRPRPSRGRRGASPWSVRRSGNTNIRRAARRARRPRRRDARTRRARSRGRPPP